MLSCNLDLLSVTESWLTSHDSTTIADLTNSLEDYTVYHLPRSTCRGGGPAVIARKGLHVLRNKSCVLSSFKHFDLTITSGDKVSRLVTVYRPPPSKKNGFTVERFFFFRILCVISGVDCYILSIPSLWWFQLSRRWQLKCKHQNVFFFLLICHLLYEFIGNILSNWSQGCEKAFCAVKCALTSAATVSAQ